MHYRFHVKNQQTAPAILLLDYNYNIIITITKDIASDPNRIFASLCFYLSEGKL